eukprot:c20663_g1_i2.p1 GENE.c20663_g1_i2~~c20663_g1_i2.p1  ORF type:complete len:488 (+),score=113.83 c20663_g1_i2:349-1812(+)
MTDSGFYPKLLESLAAALPLCFDMLLLCFFYMFFFAMVGMEFLGDVPADTRTISTNGVTADYSETTVAVDWADAGTALTSMFIINVGNDWARLMDDAYAGGNDWSIYLFFIVTHFIAMFLLLNIIQSLFVYTFSTFLSHTEFEATVEFEIRHQLERLYEISGDSFKKISRRPKIEFLLLSWDDLDKEYNSWLREQQSQPHATAQRYVDFGGIQLCVSPLDRLFAEAFTRKSSSHLKRTASAKFRNLQRQLGMQEFLKNNIGAKRDSTARKRRFTTFSDDPRYNREAVIKGKTESSVPENARHSNRHGVALKRSNTEGGLGKLHQPTAAELEKRRSMGAIGETFSDEGTSREMSVTITELTTPRLEDDQIEHSVHSPPAALHQNNSAASMAREQYDIIIERQSSDEELLTYLPNILESQTPLAPPRLSEENRTWSDLGARRNAAFESQSGDDAPEMVDKHRGGRNADLLSPHQTHEHDEKDDDTLSWT